MTRPFDQAHGGGMPDYYDSHPASRQQHRMRAPPQMSPNHPAAPNAWSPTRQSGPQLQPKHHAPSNGAWEPSPNVYDDSGYDYEEDYSQSDQWPLPAQPLAPSPPARGNPGRPPQRPQRHDEQPQRPEYQPHILDQPRIAPHAHAASRQYRQPAPPPALHHGTGQWTGDGYNYAAPPPASHHGTGQWTGDGYSYATPPPSFPPPTRPLPHAHAQSSITTYAGPHVPQQAVYARANPRPLIGPPPSARRGPCLYYPHVGPVMPIAQETGSMRGTSLRSGSVHTGAHENKTSSASNTANPIGTAQLHQERGREAARQSPQRPELVSESQSEYFHDSPTEPAIARGRIRTPEPCPQYREQSSPEGTVVRQASLGKKSRPTLTTVTSGDGIRKGSGSTTVEPKSGITTLPSRQQSQSELARAPAPIDSTPERTERVAPPAAAVAAAWTPVQQSDSSPASGKQTSEVVVRSGTGLIDASDPPESEGKDHAVRRKRSQDLLSAELAKQLHQSIVGSLEQGGALSAKGAEELKQPMGGLSDRAGKRRPPRINVDAVRDAEARGSLTSLPDLIRRATKLASNLDRGKTASRLGMSWLDGTADGEKRRSGSVSDILASFPAPALAPSPDLRNGRWSSRFRHSALPSDSDAGEGKRKRRCCGMPLWAFCLLMVLLLLLTAAAVVAPVVLIVIPKQNDDTSSTK